MASTLKRLKVDAPVAETAKKSDIPQVNIPGKGIAAYNEAVANQKAAEATVKEQKPIVLQAGLAALFKHNTETPSKPLTSIELVDDTGAAVRLTHQNRYSQVDADACCRVFDQIALARGPKAKIDPNDFVHEIVVPSFNTAVLMNKDGSFNEEIFNLYHKAIANLTADLVQLGKLEKGTTSPLESVRKFVPKETFHAERWAAFKTVTEQRAIQLTMPNTVTLTALAEK